MFLTKLLISFHGVQFVNPYANCELPLSKTTKTDRKVKISIFYPLKHPLYVKVMLIFYLPYLTLSDLLYLCNVIIKILNVMSRKKVSVVFFDCRLKKKLLTSGDVVYSVSWCDFNGCKFLREFSSYSDLIKFLSKFNLDFN